MAEFTIIQAHKLTPDQAHAAAQKMVEKLAEDFDLAFEWEGEVLSFQRSGVQGSLSLRPLQAEMYIKLGFLMSTFAAKIEAQVAEHMQAVFGAG